MAVPSPTRATAWFLPFVASMLALLNLSNDGEGRVTNRIHVRDEYDFVIVGAGSSGSVIANRLTEDPRVKVLLLEAGGDESEISDVPILAAYLQLGDLDWKYKTEPQEGRACLGMVDGRCNWPRGKVLGGSSVLNYMLYVRGNRVDYDRWGHLGNVGWNYRDALKYFMKSEDNRNPYLAQTPYHATGGYLTVQEAPWRTPLATAFVKGGEELGFENNDGNGAKQTGFMIPQGTLRRGRRCSTAKAFLRPIRRRPNLDVAMNAFVTRILIDKATKTATGVRYLRYGKLRSVRARREVILAAGAINTPHLMMLSGIGPKDHLESLGIPVVQRAEGVGANLMDHYGTGALTFTVPHPISLVQSRIENVESVVKYVLFGTGPLTVMGGVEGLAWIPTKFVNASSDYPDIEIHFVSGSLASDGGLQTRRAHGIDELRWRMYEPLSFKDTWSAIPMLLRPKSRGRISLRSSHPLVKPKIEAGYFSHPDDLKTLVEGMKLVLKLSETRVFRDLGSRFFDQIPMPGCDHLELWTDDYWGCLARHYTATIYHYSGTAKMGPKEDAMAVVSPELKVYGVKRLRVVDASIMPEIVSGNTNAPVIMLAEKGADLIKADWRSSRGRRRSATKKSIRWPIR